MTVLLERRGRVPPGRGWDVSLVAGLTGLAALCEALAREYGASPVTCPFRAVTGLPCATCGSTRAGLALLDGRASDAFLLNPMVMTAAAALALVLAVRLVTGRQLVIHLSRGERLVAWALAGMVFFANWTYVILRHAGDRPGF